MLERQRQLFNLLEMTMKCPHCDIQALVMSDRQGVEIDYCPQCRGVWLDRGELDKLIERSASQTQAPQPAARPQQQPQGWSQPHPQHQSYHHKKHKSWLSEIFD
jgi:Zn-finger nucleic acid-binding protein